VSSQQRLGACVSTENDVAAHLSPREIFRASKVVACMWGALTLNPISSTLHASPACCYQTHCCVEGQGGAL
jgi:hypothetical protein